MLSISSTKLLMAGRSTLGMTCGM
uniref:Uncharacterized protein n=1 Tax=Solanum lycopersicum TaxID=4081 RepID=A0A3Q7JDQ8_SOLLC